MSGDQSNPHGAGFGTPSGSAGAPELPSQQLQPPPTAIGGVSPQQELETLRAYVARLPQQQVGAIGQSTVPAPTGQSTPWTQGAQAGQAGQGADFIGAAQQQQRFADLAEATLSDSAEVASCGADDRAFVKRHVVAALRRGQTGAARTGECECI